MEFGGFCGRNAGVEVDGTSGEGDGGVGGIGEGGGEGLGEGGNGEV